MNRVLNSLPLITALLVVGLASTHAEAKPEYPQLVNDWCSQENRIPAQPIPAAFPASCDTCHMSGSYNGGSKNQPAFDEMKLAKSSNDFSYFCQLLANANTPPVLAPIGSQTASEGSPLSFRVIATDADGDALSCTASDLPPGAIFSDNGDGTGEFAWTPGFDQSGNYAVTFTVVDNAAAMGSVSEAVTISVGNVNRPPVIAPIGNQTVNEGETLLFSVTATDPDQDAIVLAVFNRPAGVTLTDNGDGTALFSWSPVAGQAANYPISISATDRGSPPQRGVETFTVTVGVINRPPVLATIGNRETESGMPLSIPMTAADPDGGTLRFSVADAPLGAQFADFGDGTAEFNWTPALDQVGNHQVTFTVFDDGNPMASDSEQLTITVGRVNRPPVLGAIGDQSVDAGNLLSFVVTASDPDGDALLLEAALPVGARFTDLGNGSAEFSWTPSPAQVGNHAATFSVTDFGVPPEQDTESINISVGAVNTPPSLTPIGERSARVGEPLTVTVMASDLDGDALRCDAVGLPAGASFVDNGDGSAELSWLPGADQVGRYGVIVTVYDSGLPIESDSERFDIVVQPAAGDVVPVDELYLKRARWKVPELRIEGRTDPGSSVELLDADSGFVLATVTADNGGKFKLRTTPYVVPCAVQARVGTNLSPVVLVEDAPDTCGQMGFAYLRIKDAEWDCEDARLSVKGDRAPRGAMIVIYDADTAQPIGETLADGKGKFRYRDEVDPGPYRIEVGVLVDPEVWLVDPIEVEEDCDEDDDDDDEDDDHDDDDEDDD